MAEQIVIALILGLVEGLTEFIPVSSTGHLVLVQQFLPAGSFLSPKSMGTFDVLIQLGAIFAVLLVYFRRLVEIVKTLPRSARTQHFVLAVLFSFLPAAIIGALAHDFIKNVLFETPILICVVLILGGFVLLAVDKIKLQPQGPRRAGFFMADGDRRGLLPMPGNDPRNVSLGFDDRRRAAARRRQAIRGGIFFLPRHADDGRRFRSGSVEEPS